MITRLVLVLVAATALVALGASAAAASRAIRIENPAFTATGTISLREGAFGAVITCTITLRGRLVNEIIKANARRLPEGRIGTIERVETANCRALGVNWVATFLTPIDLRTRRSPGNYRT